MTLQGRHIHFVGIDGIGMSGVAQMALDKGAVVSGCDACPGANAQRLADRGCRIRVGHDPAHLGGVELVVRSSAIPDGHPELAAALARRIPVVGRARLLARLASDYRLVAVTGAHGKTTTTWLVGKLLLEAGLDPTILVGGLVDDLGGNYRLGCGELLVAEVDESDGSHLEFTPHYSIITNLDHEHVDRYPTLDAVQAIFREYLRRTRPDGCIIACIDSAPLRDILGDWGDAAARLLTYGTTADAQVRAENIRLQGARSTFDVCHPWGHTPDLSLALPGRHNVLNALAAVALAGALGIPDAAVRAAFGHVRGVGRRLEHKGSARGIRLFDDYAHHPAEIRATVEAARRLADGGRVVGVFQPHRYTRTQGLGERFADCFDALDHLVVLPIYAAGEPPIEGVSADLIVRNVRRRGAVECVGFSDWGLARRHLLGVLRPGDTLLTLGAGNVYQFGEQVLADLNKEPARCSSSAT